MKEISKTKQQRYAPSIVRNECLAYCVNGSAWNK